jgi:hypothetical protein
VINLVNAARQRVVLITPYWKLWGHLDSAIQQAAQRKAAVEVVFRADKADEYRELTSQFHRAGARVRTVHNLHAKVYLNEAACIVTSMNLHEFSAQHSEEFALYSSEPQLYTAVSEFTAGLLAKSTELKAQSTAAKILQGVAKATVNAVGTVGAVMDAFKPGKCIRCGKDVPYNPDIPMCDGCYASWSRYKNRDYPEKYCHDCGGQKQTTIAKPVCLACYRAGK